MKTEMRIPVRAYAVKIRDERTSEKKNDVIVLTKEQLRAGAMFNMDDEAIIWRIYNRQGYRVMEIGRAEKLELTVDLHALYYEQAPTGEEVSPQMEQLMAFGRAHSEVKAD